MNTYIKEYEKSRIVEKLSNAEPVPSLADFFQDLIDRAGDDTLNDIIAVYASKHEYTQKTLRGIPAMRTFLALVADEVAYRDAMEDMSRQEEE